MYLMDYSSADFTPFDRMMSWCVGVSAIQQVFFSSLLSLSSSVFYTWIERLYISPYDWNVGSIERKSKKKCTWKWKSQDRWNSPNIHSLYHKIGSQVNDRAPWIRPGFGSCLSHSRAGSARNVISIATVNHYSVHELIDWMMMNAPIMQQSRVWGRCSILYLNAHLPLFVAFVLFVALLLFLCTALRKCLWLFVPVRSLAINAKLMFHTCWSFSERVKNSLDHIRTQRVCVCVDVQM